MWKLLKKLWKLLKKLWKLLKNVWKMCEKLWKMREKLNLLSARACRMVSGKLVRRFRREIHHCKSVYQQSDVYSNTIICRLRVFYLRKKVYWHFGFQQNRGATKWPISSVCFSIHLIFNWNCIMWDLFRFITMHPVLSFDLLLPNSMNTKWQFWTL